MSPADAARRQRCRSLELAAVLGVLLAVYAAIRRDWPAIVVGLVGSGVALAVRRSVCRGLDDDS
jgi:hypothetical protein